MKHFLIFVSEFLYILTRIQTTRRKTHEICTGAFPQDEVVTGSIVTYFVFLIVGVKSDEFQIITTMEATIYWCSKNIHEPNIYKYFKEISIGRF